MRAEHLCLKKPPAGPAPGLLTASSRFGRSSASSTMRDAASAALRVLPSACQRVSTTGTGGSGGAFALAPVPGCSACSGKQHPLQNMQPGPPAVAPPSHLRHCSLLTVVGEGCRCLWVAVGALPRAAAGVDGRGQDARGGSKPVPQAALNGAHLHKAAEGNATELGAAGKEATLVWACLGVQ